MDSYVSLTPLGGIGDVTKNMYLYEYQDQILIVDCGLGFADETMVGVDLLLPDISYLLQSVRSGKKIVGIILTHGHEDHIGALPFILPNLASLSSSQNFPIFGTVLTAGLANEKLKEFSLPFRVEAVPFNSGELVMGSFKASLIRVTHSVPDTAHVFLQTPLGNFYHGSDFKFDKTPADGKVADITGIKKASEKGILCLMSDCLGAEKKGRTSSEQVLTESFEKEMENCRGKCIVTTYSSNISRLNQAIQVAEKLGRKVCFVGRSLIKAKEVAQRLGYMKLREGLEVSVEQLKNYKDNQLLLLVAGSQGQENSAMTRMVAGEHKDIRLKEDDLVIFSADPIPGNEIFVYSLIDAIAKKGARVIYSDISDDFHVSGHGSQDELLELISLVKPQKLLPIGGTYRHMVAYRTLAEKAGYQRKDILLIEDGQEVIFTKNSVRLGKLTPVKNVYVDEISGEEIEHFVLRDRQKLSEGGIVVIIIEIDSSSGQLVGRPDIIARGFSGFDNKKIGGKIFVDIRNVLGGKKGRLTNWIYVRKLIGEVCERRIFKELRRRPLVLPVVIEV
ncbi:MAG: ribonuclease J [Candidatus Levybacteria bacterium]|nr:ribonuclease J [Candidatus Levybacteria bacterium]MBI3070213.1 ribonuclease J [Candidatus Levybacteria bacterium]MBI3093026.1 ribonuclease J [Candidatus Levybacteria bacterium]